MSGRTRFLALLALAAPLAFAAPASGAVTIGSNLTDPGGSNTQNPGCGVPCTVTTFSAPPSLTAPGGLRSPITGVVTSWRLRSGSSSASIALRVLRPGVGTTFTAVNTGPSQAIGVGISPPLPTQQPINAGDAIGVNNTTQALILAPHPGTSIAYWNPPLADGAGTPGTIGSPFEVQVQATVEPDVDCDGRGDETQDGNLSDGPCVPRPRDTTPPTTKIKKLTENGDDAKVKFSGSDAAGPVTFECKIDKRKYRRCSSPKKFKNLDDGNHKVRVRAVDSAGNKDATPAKKKFEIDEDED